jgi:adenylyl cyclase-associated protein
MTTSPTVRYSVPNSINTSDNPLTLLVRRLEAATSRLEDIASASASFDHQNGVAAAAVAAPQSNSAPELPALNKDASASQTPTPPPPAAKEDLPPTIEAMDELISEHVSAFTKAASNLDPLISTQASSVSSAFADQRRFLLVSTKAKKPDMQSPDTFNVLLKDLQQHMGAVGDIRDSNRASTLKEHLAMVGEGIGALQWLLMEGKPADFVGETVGGAQMYGNRVLKAYKEKFVHGNDYVWTLGLTND